MFRSSSQFSSYRTPGTIDLVISNPVVLLNEIARRYETTERILMEYVDNALDDAEVLYRQNDNAYPYPIEIDIKVDFSEATITIRDNCRGMTREILERIVHNIGESDKRGLAWVNGRFGFGVHAFRAAAEEIAFQTKHEISSHHGLHFRRDQLSGIKEAQRTDDPFPTQTGTGTIVTLSKFDRDWFVGVRVASIKHEIELHFGQLLNRPGLQIRVQEIDKSPFICQPFDFHALEGMEIARNLDLTYQGERYPIELFLKITAIPFPEHSASFYARGRRVAAVSEIKSFMRKSHDATRLWTHPNLIGYIEVGEMVQPILNRDDFVRTKRRQVLYEAIIALEPEIRLGLAQVNRAERQNTLEQLEETLGSILANLPANHLSGSAPARPSAPKIVLSEALPGGGEQRARLSNGALYINTSHADFQKRLSLNRQGIPRLTDRLNAYLAGILSTYSWESLLAEGSALIDPEGLLENQLNLIYLLEENLRRQSTSQK